MARYLVLVVALLALVGGCSKSAPKQDMLHYEMVDDAKKGPAEKDSSPATNPVKAN